MGNEDLDYKWVSASSWPEFEQRINEFRKDHLIKFQTDHGYRVDDRHEIIEVWGHVFYTKREISRESSDAQIDIKPSEEEQYLIKCRACGAFFNYLKWPKCSGKNEKHGVEGIPDELKPNYERIWGKKNG